MRKLHTRQGGFTLIELMIVVAIIGILAAIAIPNFLRFQLRARSSEGKTNIAAIRTAEEGYNAEYNVFVQALPDGHLAAAPGNQKVPWTPAAGSGFNTIGWSPEGEVYFSYAVDADAPGAPGTVVDSAGAPTYTVEAWSDIDGDAVYQSWGYVHASTNTPGGGVTGFAGTYSLGALCPVGGVFDPQTNANSLLNTTGPCDNVSGQSVF